MVLPKKDIPQHLEDCSKYLKTVIDNLSTKNEELTETVSALRIKLANSEACGYDKLIETKGSFLCRSQDAYSNLNCLRSVNNLAK